MSIDKGEMCETRAARSLAYCVVKFILSLLNGLKQPMHDDIGQPPCVGEDQDDQTLCKKTAG